MTISILLATTVYKEKDTLWLGIATGILLFVILGHFATVVINWISTMVVKPKPLPKLDFSGKIPDIYSAVVAVPCLISSKAGIEELVSDLEVRYLSNPQKNLYYCLLTDFADAPREKMPQDDELLAYVQEEIHLLNKKYARENDTDRFFLCIARVSGIKRKGMDEL
ncbi:hypothetical protein KRR40_18810 [Niabella defluvii]|nr:hypothetical protein KRR40_18810 [Niabella sp. I65]